MAALGGADRVTSPSQFVADRLTAAGLGRDVLVIRNGSGTTDSEDGREITSAPGDLSGQPPGHARRALLIGVFGRPHPAKGIDFLISAFVALPPGSAELHLHGAVASDLAEAPPPGVFLHGPYAPEEVSRKMAAVDLVAIPSLWDENHPMVACEAIRARRPLLVSDLGGLPELVQQGASGWVAPAGAAEAWAEQLALLAADPARVRRAHAAMEEPRSATAMAADFVEVYRGVV
jgi:glycosyltransferase involved in cell wall biosynthesis